MKLEGPVRAFVETRRSAVLATHPQDRGARLVPICFVLDKDGEAVWSPLDEKPKRQPDPRVLARVRDIEARADVALLFERWSEDWSELAWVRLSGCAALTEPDSDVRGHRAAVLALRAKYPQYRDHRLEQLPMLRISIIGATTWSAAGDVRS